MRALNFPIDHKTLTELVNSFDKQLFDLERNIEYYTERLSLEESLYDEIIEQHKIVCRYLRKLDRLGSMCRTPFRKYMRSLVE